MTRFLRFASAALVLVGVVAAASAQAASNKPYTANVRLESASNSNTFRLTLTNDPKASQSLGSANFTLPPNFTAPDGTAAISNVSSGGFSVSVASNIVEFRATSSATALGKGASVYADVTVTVPGAAQCTNAAWTVEAKQSNDFSGTPGNDMTLGAASDLTPLASFEFGTIQTVLPGSIAVPQILTNAAAPLGITALDTCGNPDSDYTGATLAPLSTLDPPRLVNATFSALTWTTAANGDRVGSATLTPVDVEPADQVVVTDPSTQITAVSNSFDVVEKICAVTGTACRWSNSKNTITATSTVGQSNGNGPASLGLGFRPLGTTCTVSGTVKASFGDGIQIVPLNYSGTYTIVLVYAKSVSGNGPASGFSVCKSTDDGVTWAALATCGKTPVAPCADPTRTSTGALQITLYLNPGDPLSGGFS
jgi:hypothetical protein